MLATEHKQNVIGQYRTHDTDTGSPEVQIALLSGRIGQLTDHFKLHKKDHDAERYKIVMGKSGQTEVTPLSSPAL